MPTHFCLPHALLPGLPARDPGAPTGSQFVASIGSIPFDALMDAERERAYIEQFLRGNIPDFMRNLVPVEISDGSVTATMFVMPDYLCIGSDEDFVLVPMNPLSAQGIVDSWGGQLPTKKIVSAIIKSGKKMNFRAMTPPKYPYDHSMMHTGRYVKHNEWIAEDRELHSLEPGELLVGHKKDVIIDTWLERADIDYKRVGVYGGLWNGNVIHNFRTHSHNVHYKDYSHGIRCVSDTVFLGETETASAREILCDPKRFKLLSDQPKEFKTARYPV